MLILDSGVTTQLKLCVCLVACMFVLCGDILINVATFLRRSWAPPVKTAAEERSNVFTLAAPLNPSARATGLCGTRG